MDVAPDVIIPGQVESLKELLEKRTESRSNCIKGKTLSYLSGTSLKVHDLII